ncbi:MAG TPA: hypothetical protein VJQ46_06295 [Gemmatimonadales bacterium]|nr:hypothetical protein [Gemmatimonadales bacterium]
MTGRAVQFSEANPDTDPGQAVLEARLKEVRSRMEMVAAAQRRGLTAVHTASLEKRRSRRESLAGPIAHLSEIGRLAAKDHPELVALFRYKPSKDTLAAHLTAARTMQAQASEHKEVLSKYGMSDAVLAVFGQLLDQFDAAVKLGNEGRGTHTGATRELRALAREARRTVRAMDARNRYRFKNDEQKLGAWISASTVVARPGSGSEAGAGPTAASGGLEGGTAGGDVRPAA